MCIGSYISGVSGHQAGAFIALNAGISMASVYLPRRAILDNTVHGRSLNLREISRGVPQGTVLGPLLWNLV